MKENLELKRKSVSQEFPANLALENSDGVNAPLSTEPEEAKKVPRKRVMKKNPEDVLSPGQKRARRQEVVEQMKADSASTVVRKESRAKRQKIVSPEIDHDQAISKVLRQHNNVWGDVSFKNPNSIYDSLKDTKPSIGQRLLADKERSGEITLIEQSGTDDLEDKELADAAKKTTPKLKSQIYKKSDQRNLYTLPLYKKRPRNFFQKIQDYLFRDIEDEDE